MNEDVSPIQTMVIFYCHVGFRGSMAIKTFLFVLCCMVGGFVAVCYEGVVSEGVVSEGVVADKRKLKLQKGDKRN